MADNNLPAKRKRVLNSKLTSEDNVHRDAVKRRQLEGMQSSANTSATANHSSRQASVEAINDEEDHVPHNAGPPKNPNSILEATDDESDKELADLVRRRKRFHPQPGPTATASHSAHPSCQASVEAIDDEEDHVHHNAGPPKNPKSILEGTDDESDEDSGLQEETDEQELSKATIHTLFDRSSHLSSAPPKGLAIPGLCLLSP